MAYSTPKRILQICSSSATSGAERHVYSLSRQLTEKGHRVEVWAPKPGWLPDITQEAGISCRISPMRGADSYRTLGTLIRRVRRHDIDVVHTHLTRAAYIGHMLGLITRVPIITSVHIANNDQIYRRLAKRRNKLVAVSNFVRGMLHGKGINPRYIETIYNGTDFVDIAPSEPGLLMDELGIPRERRLVGLVGQVSLWKGHLELVKALPAVQKEHPDAHTVFVGRVDETFEAELNAVIDDTGMRDHITMTGVRHDIPRVLDAMTLCTLPSHMETFGVAAIEAMARGKAVVATRVGALPEVVRHKQTGLLVDLRPEEIAEAVSYLLTNDEEREAMGRMGRHIVEQKFTLDEMVRRFEKVYSEAVAIKVS